MKRFFTLAAVAAVAATSFAGNHSWSEKQWELSAEGRYRLQAFAEQCANDKIAGIERPGVIKRSFQQGNILWEAIMVLDGPAGMFFQGNPSIEELPYYGVEYVLEGTNIQTNQKFCQTSMLMAYPTQYVMDLKVWDGPWEEGVNEKGEKTYDIPEEMCDYSAYPLSEFMAQPDDMSRRFMDTAKGYVNLTMPAPEGAPAGQEGPSYGYGIWSMGAVYYNGRKDYNLYSDWDYDNQTTENFTEVVLNDYSPDDDTLVTSNRVVYAVYNEETGKFSGNPMKFNLDYEGTAYVKGFETTTYNVENCNVALYNAGPLDSESMGDSYPFYDDPTEPTDLWFLTFCCEDITSICEADKPIAFDREKVKFYILDKDKEVDLSNSFFTYGYLFSKQGQEPFSTEWTLERAEEFTFDIFGKEVTVYDYMTPSPGHFYYPREYYGPGELSEWSVNYGMMTIFANNWIQMPEEWGFVANNTFDGAIYKFETQFGDIINMTTKNDIEFHPSYDDMTKVEYRSSTGDYVPEFKEPNAVKATEANNVSVIARNGRICVVSDKEADVAIYSLNGGLLKAGRTGANTGLMVEAPKGLYIVKVGNVARKVVL